MHQKIYTNMCLQNFCKINPKKDVIVYKLLERTNEGYGPLVSPFYYFSWGIREVYETLYTEPDMVYEDENHSTGRINGGCFHTFKKLRDARQQLKIHRNRWTPFTYIAKCRIPKNSNFIYKGKYSAANPLFVTRENLLEGYASEKLEILEILDD